MNIEKNIPIPKILRGRRKRSPFSVALAQMEVGDSTLAPNVSKAAMHQAMKRVALSLGREFTTRATNQGVRVWRTA